MNNNELCSNDEQLKKKIDDFKKVLHEIESNMGEVIMKARINENGQLVDKWLNPCVKLRGGKIVFIPDAD